MARLCFGKTSKTHSGRYEHENIEDQRTVQVKVRERG
jgi:hypothetical protein